VGFNTSFFMVLCAWTYSEVIPGCLNTGAKTTHWIGTTNRERFRGSALFSGCTSSWRYANSSSLRLKPGAGVI